jgi:hypothetical protein
MWVLVLLVVLTTIVITSGAFKRSAQVKMDIQAQPTPETGGFRDITKYAVVDYNESLPTNKTELEKRKLANKRYDGQDWVSGTPHPNTGGVGRYDETTPPEIIPANESNLIIVGEVIEINAHMSNDKRGVYSEFAVQVKEILKNDAAKNVEQGGVVFADRAGGFVRYSNGQRIIYESAQRPLPFISEEYVLFLTSDESPNYAILMVYELKGNRIIQLDEGRKFDEFKDATKSAFLDAIRKKISKHP